VRCEEPVTILEILRLTAKGLSQRQIADSVKCGKSTVGDIQRRCKQIGLDYDQASNFTGSEIKKLVYPVSSGRKANKYLPDFALIHQTLQAGSNKNLQYLWEEYRLTYPEGLSYSQYCERYRRWKNNSSDQVTMHIEREPGREMFVDWMGKTLALVVDPITGQHFKVHFFATTLGYSGMPYVEAFADQKQQSWQQGHINAFNYYGGTSLILKPDNCKTAVTKPHHYEPIINPAYWELAKYYNLAVIPARIKRPKDKAQVESSIGWLETWLLGWLEGQIFFSFAELNQEIRKRLEMLVERPFKERPGSRLSNFIEYDQPKLRPLPAKSFEAAEMLLKRVPDNYHVEYDGCYYSVPFNYYNQTVTLRATATTIELLDQDRLRIASHPRSTKKRYTTDPAHMPEKHRRFLEAQQFNGHRYRSWAGKIGPKTFFVIDKILKSGQVEEQGYRACMGLLQLSKNYDYGRLEAACHKAATLGSPSYTTVANILKNNQDQSLVKAKSSPTPDHENIRGAAYFS
jgi:transposase